VRNIVIAPLAPIRISVEAEILSPDIFAPLSMEQICGLDVWQGNRKKKISDLFRVVGDEGPAKPEETALRLEGDFSRVKRIAEGMTAGTVDVTGSVGMHAEII